MIKILNLYAGIGGNRKLWEDCKVTAVEKDMEIAQIYKDFFPQDNVIVADAHEFLLENYLHDWDFIWSSVPCTSHSAIKAFGIRSKLHEACYIDMKLWQEIIFLKEFSKCKFAVENVKPYYEPFVKPDAQIGRHYFWTNFRVRNIGIPDNEFDIQDIRPKHTVYGFNISMYRPQQRRDQILRNMVNPLIGKHILDQAFNKPIKRDPSPLF